MGNKRRTRMGKLVEMIKIVTELQKYGEFIYHDTLTINGQVLKITIRSN